MIQNGVTTKTPQNILFGAGVYFHGVTYNEKVAPDEATIKAHVFGATQEGGTVSIIPTLFHPELDDVLVKVAEFQSKIGEESKMDVSFVEVKADDIAHMTLGVVSETTDKSYDVITTSSIIRKGHFYEGLGFYGRLLDGRPFIIMYKKALCTSGFTGDPKSKTNALFKATFECHSDLEYGTTKLPIAIFIRKAEGWTAVDPDEVATTTNG